MICSAIKMVIGCKLLFLGGSKNDLIFMVDRDYVYGQETIFPGKLRVERLNKLFSPKIPPAALKKLIYNSISAIH